MQAFEQFLKYKLRIPVRGAIMLNEAMDSAVLVKGWKKGANWSFPRGKINKDEDDLTCAIREVFEETGYDLEAAGLVPQDRNVKYIDLTIRDQDLRLYVFRGVPMDTHFEPKTRKEISKIQWWRISDLPSFHKKGHQQAEAAVNANKFYMVAPFIRGVRKWAAEQKNKDSARTTSNQYLSAGMSHDEFLTEEDQGAESNVPDTEPSVPNIHQLETALRTALKIQPPTQGLQLDAITAIQSPVRDTGQELLALLQGKTQPPNQAAQSNLPPQTPQDHILAQPPVPKAPHHQQPRPPVFQSFPSVPAFPAHLRTELSNQPPQAVRNERLLNLPPPPVFPSQDRDALSQLDSNHSPHHYPFNGATFQQGQMRGEQQRELAPKNPHSHQPQHLVHPQPLPPQVQRTVFIGGPVHVPTVPQSHQQPSAPHLNPAASQMLNPPFPNTSAISLSAQKQPPPKLTDHSLALLNAFKSHNQTAGNNSVSNNAALLQKVTSERQVPPQELPAEVSNGPPVDLLSMFNVQQPESSPILKPGTSRTEPPVEDAHRSSLLNLFKAPTRTSLTPRPAATAFPTSTTPSAVELSAVEPLSSNAVPTSTSSMGGQGTNYRERNVSIPELHPDSNLPFRAISILARPAEANGSDRQAHRSSTNEAMSSAEQSRTAPSKLAEKPFQPQILKRPQPQVHKPAEPPNTVPSGLPALPVQSSFDHRSSQTADHKQTLLSLFGKGPSPPEAVSQNLTGGSFAPLLVAGQTGTPPRTRIGSLASEAPSRTGSQALSPADKSFLLSYLDNVAKGTQL